MITYVHFWYSVKFSIRPILRQNNFAEHRKNWPKWKKLILHSGKGNICYWKKNACSVQWFYYQRRDFVIFLTRDTWQNWIFFQLARETTRNYISMGDFFRYFPTHHAVSGIQILFLVFWKIIFFSIRFKPHQVVYAMASKCKSMLFFEENTLYNWKQKSP